MKGAEKPSNLVLIVWWCTALTSASLTEDEAETILTSLKHLNVGRCVLVLETSGETGRDAARKFGREYISTAVTRAELLGEHMKVWTPPDAKMAVVVKVKSTRTVKRTLVQNWSRLYWFVWFLVAEDDLDPDIRIPFNCQFFEIRRTSSGVRLIESYNVKNSSPSRTEFANWTPGIGLKASPLGLYGRRTDLRGVQMKITVCKNYGVEESAEWFWKDSARTLNYSLTIEPRKRRKTTKGYFYPQNPDGTTCISSITKLDFEKDWIFGSFGERVRLATKFRGTNDVGWRAYVQPFTKEMWAAVGLWLLLSTAAVVVVNGPNKETLYTNVFAGLFCLCNSDPMSVHPRGGPVPLSAGLVHLMSVAVPAVLIPAYSAYILSTLSVTLPLEPFDDIEGFIKDGTYRLVAADNTFTRRYFRESNDPNLIYIHDHLFLWEEPPLPTFASLFETLCADPKLVGLFVDIKCFRSLFKCRMFVPPRNVLTISTGFKLPKRSPLRAMLNKRFRRYNEVGLKKRETNAESFVKISFEEEAGPLHSLNMSQMQAVFLLVPVYSRRGRFRPHRFLYLSDYSVVSVLVLLLLF